MNRRLSLVVISLLIAGLLAACSSPATSSSTAVSPTAARATATQAPATSSAESTAATTSDPAATAGAAASGDAIHLQLAGSGNEARYRVREQLARINLPSDAIGKTDAITGALVLNSDANVVSDQSKFVVDVTGLTSDESRRDNFVRRNVLETSTYPTVEFVPNQIIGLPSPLPTSGDVTFQLAGDLTIHGVTRPATWDVTATITDGRELSGTATTAFKFADFGLTQPRVPVVLSIEDNIRLEIDFHLVRAS